MGATLLLIGVAGVASLVLFRYFWRPAPVADPVYTVRCPGCGRKLRYRGSRAGRHGVCPACKLRFQYPTTPPAGQTP